MVEPVRGRKLAGACGLLYVVLSFAVAGLAPPPPTLAHGSAAIAEYFGKYELRFLLGNYAGVLAVLPFFPLVAYLTQLVRRAEGESGIAGLTLFAAGTVGHAAGVCCLAAFQAIGLTAPAEQKLVSDLANVLFGFFFVANAGFLGAAAWALLSTRVLPRALGYAAIPLALGSLVASAGTIATTGPLTVGGQASLVALGTYLLWCLALSVVLLLPSARDGAATAAPG